MPSNDKITCIASSSEGNTINLNFAIHTMIHS